MHRNILTSIFLISFALTACAQKDFDRKLSSIYKNTVPLIQSQELEKKMKTEKIVVLDTRTPEEYATSHLPNARFINYDKFKAKDVKDIPKDSQIIVYCAVGYRSERIGEKLLKLGFSDVHNLYGGIFDWKNDSMKVVNNHNIETDSVHTYNRNWSKWLINGIKVY